MTALNLDTCPFCGHAVFNQFVTVKFLSDGQYEKTKNQCLKCGAEADLAVWNDRAVTTGKFMVAEEILLRMMSGADFIRFGEHDIYTIDMMAIIRAVLTAQTKKVKA